MKKLIDLLCVILFLVLLTGCNLNQTNQSQDEEKLEESQIEQFPEVENVLDREIFVFKESVPQIYNYFINDMDSLKPYVENWTFGKILNEKYFKNIKWLVDEVDNGKVIIFNGESTIFSNELVPYEADIRILFNIQDSSEMPIVSQIEISSNLGDEIINMLRYNNYVDDAGAIGLADAEICVLISRLVESIEKYEEVSSINVQTGYPSYDEKIREYIKATSLGENYFNNIYNYGADCSSINGLIIKYYHNYGEMQLSYAVYDIDGNDIPELMFSDMYNIIDIYTLMDGEIVKLYENSSFGDRNFLYISNEGLLLTDGSNSASSSSCEIGRIGEKDTPINVIGAYYYDSFGENEYMEHMYTYVSIDEYIEITNSFKSQSIFDLLTWIVIASN